jgi:hypothetical protein
MLICETTQTLSRIRIYSIVHSSITYTGARALLFGGERVDSHVHDGL